MATHSTNGLYMGDTSAAGQAFVPDEVMPRNVANDIWKKAQEKTIFPALSDNVPLILGENTFPTLTKRPAASIVGELQDKIDSEIGFGQKTIRTIKAVVGLEFSMESILKNPLGVQGLLTSELSAALARQIDLAIAHKRQASDGAALTQVSEALADSTNVVNLGDYASMDEALWAGYGMTVDKHDFTGFALDPRFVFALANERDPVTGQRVNPDIPMGGTVQNYAGQRVTVGRAVSGQIDASADTGVRGFAGDWNVLKFGYALDIFYKKIEYGDPFGNGDLQRRNAVAYMAECIFGFGFMDLDAMVVYRDAESAPDGGDGGDEGDGDGGDDGGTGDE